MVNWPEFRFVKFTICCLKHYAQHTCFSLLSETKWRDLRTVCNSTLQLQIGWLVLWSQTDFSLTWKFFGKGPSRINRLRHPFFQYDLSDTLQTLFEPSRDAFCETAARTEEKSIIEWKHTNAIFYVLHTIFWNWGSPLKKWWRSNRFENSFLTDFKMKY